MNKPSTKYELIKKYKTLSDGEKNTELLSVLCGILEERAIDGIVDENTLGLINAISRCFNISIQFKSNSVEDMKTKLKDLLGEE
jgi:hypothetical protein